MKKLTKEEPKSKLKMISYAKVRGKSEYYKMMNKLMKNPTKQEQAFDEQFDPMKAIEQLVDEAKRLKEKYSNKEKGAR